MPNQWIEDGGRVRLLNVDLDTMRSVLMWMETGSLDLSVYAGVENGAVTLSNAGQCHLNGAAEAVDGFEAEKSLWALFKIYHFGLCYGVPGIRADALTIANEIMNTLFDRLFDRQVLVAPATTNDVVGMICEGQIVNAHPNVEDEEIFNAITAPHPWLQITWPLEEACTIVAVVPHAKRSKLLDKARGMVRDLVVANGPFPGTDGLIENRVVSQLHQQLTSRALEQYRVKLQAARAELSAVSVALEINEANLQPKKAALATLTEVLKMLDRIATDYMDLSGVARAELDGMVVEVATDLLAD